MHVKKKQTYNYKKQKKEKRNNIYYTQKIKLLTARIRNIHTFIEIR